MFIGHLALGFAAKRVAPDISLSVLFAAAQFADLLWPVLLAFGIEQVRIEPGNTAFSPLNFIHYPYSHSLLMLVIWGALFGLVYKRLVLCGLVVSHWFLDFLTHRPDMPLYPAGPRFGLALWDSIPWTIVVEALMYIIGVWIYARATETRDKVGYWAFTSLVGFLSLVYVANIIGGAPPSVPAIYFTGVAGGLVIVAWGWWVDNHREIPDKLMV